MHLYYIFPFLACLNLHLIEDYGLNVLRRYMGLFPESMLTQAIRGYFLYYDIPSQEEKEEEEKGEHEPEVDDSDPFDLVLVSFINYNLFMS